jgi:hypothetical protein
MMMLDSQINDPHLETNMPGCHLQFFQSSTPSERLVLATQVVITLPRQAEKERKSHPEEPVKRTRPLSYAPPRTPRSEEFSIPHTHTHEDKPDVTEFGRPYYGRNLSARHFSRCLFEGSLVKKHHKINDPRIHHLHNERTCLNLLMIGNLIWPSARAHTHTFATTIYPLICLSHPQNTSLTAHQILNQG